jgi:hypothetical protein
MQHSGWAWTIVFAPLVVLVVFAAVVMSLR